VDPSETQRFVAKFCDKQPSMFEINEVSIRPLTSLSGIEIPMTMLADRRLTRIDKGRGELQNRSHASDHGNGATVTSARDARRFDVRMDMLLDIVVDWRGPSIELAPGGLCAMGRRPASPGNQRSKEAPRRRAGLKRSFDRERWKFESSPQSSPASGRGVVLVDVVLGVVDVELPVGVMIRGSSITALSFSVLPRRSATWSFPFHTENHRRLRR
jgi:hypothetical protein